MAVVKNETVVGHGTMEDFTDVVTVFLRCGGSITCQVT